MITRENVLEAMKEDCELEKLVNKVGGVDKTVAGVNFLIPIFEDIYESVSKFVEEFKEAFEQSREERLAESFIDDVCSGNCDSCMDNIDIDKEEHEEENLFQKALAMCDVDVEWRYNYLNELLCDLEDESMELYEEIEKATIDQEIAEILITDYNVDVRNDLAYANKRVVQLQKELDEVEYRYEAVSDLYDDCLFGIYQNYDDVKKLNDKNEEVVNRLFF